MKIKEVTVFTNGDSSKVNTWSNVPFFFTETLISKGIKVNRVDLSASHRLEKIYNKTINRLLKRTNKKTTYEYFRSFTHFINIKLRIRKALTLHPHSDANIFLTFSFSSFDLSKKPSVLFCDWTYDYYFRYFLNREPDFLERLSIKREDTQIENSDFIFPLFKSVSDYMKKQYKNQNIFYIGNVVNTSLDIQEFDYLKTKKKSNSLLFIGSEKYIDGAKTLIHAFNNLKQKYNDLELHLIGINDYYFENRSSDVHFYGYLNKGNNEERELYYRLVKEAKMFINTTPKWGGFSATVEAMYFFNPVIVNPYDEFLEIFGKDIEFGCYCELNSSSLLEKKIEFILNNSSYDSLCYNSHNAVKEFTWTLYIDRLLEIIEEKINKD